MGGGLNGYPPLFLKGKLKHSNTNKQMAHNLNFNPYLNRHAFVSVKERPWHGLGKVVESAMTAAQCITLAGLDFEVVKVPNYADLYYDQVLVGHKSGIDNLNPLVSIPAAALKERLRQNPKTYSTIRTDQRVILGTVGADYTVVNNAEAFEFFDAIVGTQAAIYETAGALGLGETIFITAKIPTQIKLDSDNKDVIDRYIVLSNTHDGSRSLEAFVTTIRVVCNNTLAAARNAATCKFRIRHTKNVKLRVDAARDILKLETDIIEAFANNAVRMTSIKVNHQDKVNVLTNMFLSGTEWQSAKQKGLTYLADIVSSRKLNQMAEIMGHIERGPGQDLITTKDTLWGIYNGIASYYQNGKSYSDQTDRMNSILYGDSYNKITSAYNTVLDIMPELV